MGGRLAASASFWEKCRNGGPYSRLRICPWTRLPRDWCAHWPLRPTALEHWFLSWVFIRIHTGSIKKISMPRWHPDLLNHSPLGCSWASYGAQLPGDPDEQPGLGTAAIWLVDCGNLVVLTYFSLLHYIFWLFKKEACVIFVMINRLFFT